jgi:hypothetical protein
VKPMTKRRRTGFRGAVLGLLCLAGAACERQRDGEIRAGDLQRPGEIVGVLTVTSTEAYIEHQGRRISLVEAPPQTAASHTALMAQSAAAFRSLDGTRVRARGSLQGSILWDAEVTTEAKGSP